MPSHLSQPSYTACSKLVTGFNFPSVLANFLLIWEALDHSIQVALLGEWGHVNIFQRTNLENHLRKTPSSTCLFGHLGNNLKKLMLYFYLLTQRIFWFPGYFHEPDSAAAQWLGAQLLISKKIRISPLQLGRVPKELGVNTSIINDTFYPISNPCINLNPCGYYYI